MKAHLRPCPSCARHVRTSEATCPFCNQALPAAFQASAAPLLPTSRLSRAAVFAFGATLAGAPACDDTTSAGPDAALVDGGGSPTADASPKLDAPPDTTPASDAAIYGAPPPDAGADAGVMAIYGAPAPPDAANQDLGGNVGPVYGAPAPRG